MATREHDAMADKTRAARIKHAILTTGSYEEMAEKTGISVSTLVRITSAKTSPKFDDVVKIAEVSGNDMHWIAYGSTKEIKQRASTARMPAADGMMNEETLESHNFIIWNLRTIESQDIRSIARQVAALSSYSYSMKKWNYEFSKFIDAEGEENEEG